MIMEEEFIQKGNKEAFKRFLIFVIRFNLFDVF